MKSRGGPGQTERFPFFCERERRKLKGIPPAPSFGEVALMRLSGMWLAAG
jgi:hypothetical protein